MSQYANEMVHLFDQISKVLDAKAEDPIERVRPEWDYLGNAVKELLAEIENEYSRRMAAVTAARQNGSARVTKISGAPRIDDTAQASESLSDAFEKTLRAQLNNARRETRSLEWLLRRMKAARIIHSVLRASIAVMFFMLLYALLLGVHGFLEKPTEELAREAEHLARGGISAFVILAVVLLPFELIKAKIVEPLEEKTLHKWERATCKREFQKLLELAIRTRIKIAEINSP